MTYLKGKKSNDKIHFDVKDDHVFIELCIIEEKYQFLRLLKFMLLHLEKIKCNLPIRYKTSQYLAPENLSFGVSSLPKKDKERFLIEVEQKDLINLMSFNFNCIPWSKYDYYLDLKYFEKNNWISLNTEDKLNLIKYELTAHPFGVLFYLDKMNRPYEIIKLIERFIKTLSLLKVDKPIKIRLEQCIIPADMNVIQYENKKDYLIKQKDFLRFFKHNIQKLISHGTLKYNTEIVENVVDDDGWTVSINKKKIKREQVNIEKKIIEMQLNQIHTELN
jgi:hypothetical protein